MIETVMQIDVCASQIYEKYVYNSLIYFYSTHSVAFCTGPKILKTSEVLVSMLVL